MNKTILLLLLLTLTATACTPSQSSLRPAQLARNFPSLAALPLADRFTAVPDILLDDLKGGDKREDYRPHPLTEADRVLTSQELANLPAPLRTVLDSRVLGISFLDNFSGGGMTWDLYDDQGNEAGFWLIFNSRLLTETASQWLTYRDNTAFATDPVVLLSETAVPEASAFRLLLTHEAAHVFDFVHGITPVAREILTKKTVAVQQGDFGYGRTYPLNASWHFYDLVQGSKPAAESLPAALEALRTSGYASFYGSQTALEDWAELVTYGVLAQDAEVEVTVRLSTGTGPSLEWSPTRDPGVFLRIAEALSRLEGLATEVNNH